MKCPNCTHNQLRGRSGMTCTKCEYEFLFDPQDYSAGYKMTDGRFEAILAKASRQGTYYFTEDEWYHVAVLKSRERSGCIFGFILLGIWIGGFFASVLSFVETPLRVVMFLLIASAIIVPGILLLKKSLPRKSWDKMVTLWIERSGGITGLIREPGLHQPPAQQAEPDIHDYGAAKLIICQHDIQVDWLVLNGFHSGNATVVVSEAGYPGYIAAQADQLLQSNPDLAILLIHDSGPEGESMKNRILSDWPVNKAKVTDLGITNAMLDQFGINKKVRASFGINFPLHAIPYHILNTLLAGCVADTGGDFCIVWESTYGADGNLDGDVDFG